MRTMPVGKGDLILKSDGSWFQRQDFGMDEGRYAIEGEKLCLSEARTGARNCYVLARSASGWTLKADDTAAIPVVLQPIS